MNSKTSPVGAPVQFSLFDSTMPLRNERTQHELPKTAQELVEVIGLECTINLVKEFPGDDLAIPEVVNGTSRMWAILVETVGPEAAEKLVRRYRGTTIYVPKCHLALIAHRDRAIVQAFDAGEPFDKIRREYRMTRRHLYRVLKKSV